MTDVWKIGQEMNATSYYEMTQFTGFVKSEIFAARAIAKVCDQMAESFDEIIQDQNDYLVEINEDLAEIEKLQKDLDTQIREQEKERSSILSKSEDEELSNEDKEKLNEINDNITQLTNDSNAKIGSLTADVQKKGTETEEKISKKTIARDFGNTAVEKGTPLANTKDKTKSFWRKTFGGWDKSATREAGKLAVDAGNNLLEQVETSVEIEKEINLKAKNKKV